MDGFLKQSTAVDLPLGPFLDETDGVTPLTGLTIAQADVRLKKNNGAWAQVNDATSATHEENGNYEKEYDATDTNTLGMLRIHVNEAGALPVWHTYMVLAANVYDSLFGGTDTLDVQVTGMGADVVTTSAMADGAITTETFAAGALNSTVLANDAITAAKLAADVTTELQSGLATAAALATVDSNVDAILLDTAEIGAAGAGLTAVPWNASWDAQVESEVADALAVYDPPTKAELDTAVANVSVDEIQATALADLFNTDSGTTYASAVAGSPVKEIADNAGGSALTEAGIADAVWDEVLAGHAGAGSAGEALDAAGGGVSAAEIADAVWDEATAGHTTSGTFGEQLKTDVDAILVDTGTTLEDRQALIKTAVDAILVDTGTTLEDRQVLIKTAVDAILVDTGTTLEDRQALIKTAADAILALLDNARTEPGSGALPVNPDMATKVDYLYKFLRNKKDNDGTKNQVYADDGSTVHHEQTTTTASGTTTVGEWEAP